MPKQFRKYITLGVLGVVVLIIISSVTIIKPGYVGVIELFGKVSPHPKYNGIHLIFPLATVHKMDTRLQEYTMSLSTQEGRIKDDDGIDALTMEGLKIKLDITGWFRLDPEQAPRIFQEIGLDYVEKIVRPTLRTAIRDVVVRYTAENIYSSKRDSVITMIAERTKKLSESKGIIIDEILLRNIVLPTRVQDEIDSKLAADQEAQKMEFIVEKERLEKERKIVEAEGIKEANQIISEGLTNNYIRWYRIEMLKQLVNSPNNTIVILPEDLKASPFIINN